MKYLIEFIIFFIIIFLYYYFLATKRFKAKYGEKTKINLPEAKLLILCGHLDMKKVNYKILMKQITFIFSTILSLTVLSLELFDSIFLKVLLGLAVLIILTIISYKLLLLYYKKKGMIKNV